MKEDRIYLLHIRDAIEKVLKYTAVTKEVFLHEYFGVNYELIWDAIQKDFPGLREEIQKILQKGGGRL